MRIHFKKMKNDLELAHIEEIKRNKKMQVCIYTYMHVFMDMYIYTSFVHIYEYYQIYLI
jgi:hypothetical protein